jgi:hypothetical protein
MSPLFWHQPFHNLVRLFPGLFWGQPIDSGGYRLHMRYVSSDGDFKFWDFLVLFRFPQMEPRVIHYYRFQCFCPVFRINWLTSSKMFLICLHSLKTKPFVHVWGRKSRSSVINNRKSFHLVRILSSPNGAPCHSLLPISMFLSSFSNKLIKSEWNSLQLIIFKVKHTWNNFFEPFVHVWGRKSRSSVIKNRKLFHLVRVFSRQWQFL